MKNNNRFILGGLATAALTGCGGQPEPPRRPMNILYIMTDDHTSQMMSCYDGRYASTPNLDRIAEEGVRFTNSFVANSLSGPSRACMLTGKHSHKNGFYDNTTCVFDGSQQTFPKLSARPDTKRPSSGNGISKASRRASTIGKYCPGRETTTTPTSSGRRETRCAAKVISRTSSPTRASSGSSTDATRRSPSVSWCTTRRSTATGWPTRATSRFSRTARSPCGDLLRRLRRTSGSRRTGDVHRLEPRHGPDIRPQNAAAGPEKPPQRRIRGDDRTHEPGTARGVGPLLRADRSGLLRPQPAGARTGRMEVHPLHARLPQNAQIPRRQRGTAARLPRGVGTRREHPRSVHLRPGILHGRARLVRQTVHVRGVAADPARDADAGRCEGTDRGDGPEHRLRPHVPRAGRSAVPEDIQGRSLRPCCGAGIRKTGESRSTTISTNTRPSTW